MFKLLLIFCLSLNAWAVHKEGEEPSVKRPSVTPAPKKETLSRGWSAKDEDVLAAPCRRPPPEMKDIEDYLSTKRNYDIHSALGDLNPRNDLQSLPKEKYIQYHECTTDLCKAKALYGEKIGPKLLYLRLRYGINASHLAADHAAPYYEEDLDRLMVGLQDYPVFMFPLFGRRQVTVSKFKRKHMLPKDTPEEDVKGEVFGFFFSPKEQIYFYDFWENLKTDASKEYVVVHELAHLVGEATKLHLTTDWFEVGQWNTPDEGKTWVPGNPNRVSVYGNTNPFEDFAETLTAYRYRGQELLIRDPERFRFMKEAVFNGISFTSDQTCNLNRTYTYQVAKDAHIRSHAIDPKIIAADSDLMKEITAKCEAIIISQYGLTAAEKKNRLKEFERCIEKATASRIRQHFLAQRKLKYGHLAAPNLDKSIARLTRYSDVPPPLSKSQEELIAQKAAETWEENLPIFLTFHDYHPKRPIDYPDEEAYCEARWNTLSTKSYHAQNEAMKANQTLKKKFMDICREILLNRIDLYPPLTKDEIAIAIKGDSKARDQSNRIAALNKLLELAKKADTEPEYLLGEPQMQVCINRMFYGKFDHTTRDSMINCLKARLTYGLPPLTELSIDPNTFPKTIEVIVDNSIKLMFSAFSQRFVTQAQKTKDGWLENPTEESVSVFCREVANPAITHWKLDLDFYGVSLSSDTKTSRDFAHDLCLELAIKKPPFNYTKDEIWLAIESRLTKPPSTPSATP